MKILIFHPVTLPPKAYGGVERIVYWLTKGLRELGHDVWVAALEGSELPLGAKLIPIAPDDAHPSVLLKKNLPQGLDLIHFFTPPGSGDWTSQLPCPFVFTLQGNGQEGEIFPRNTVFISRNHAERHGGEVVVYNSVDPSEYVYNGGTRSSSYLFLSKTNWRVKNLAGARRYCRRAKAPLWISGGNLPLGARLSVQLKEKLGLKRERWCGPVGGRKKAELLAQAKAFLFPILWPEPFGIVVAEALVSGTPVLAHPRGSVPELLTPEVGHLVQGDDEWQDWLTRDKLPFSPEACRAHALKEFHYLQMSQKYADVYATVRTGRFLHEEAPIGKSWSLG